MLNLQDRNWFPFSVGELFTVSRPAARSKDDYEEGDIPFIASGSTDNGVAKYCKPKAEEALDAPKCLTVSPVDGSCFYQPVSFLGRGGGGSSIMLLRNEAINCFNGVFVARMLSHTLGSKYTYGRMGNAKTILREQLLLPTDEAGDPDWQFMEDYIREREAIQVQRCRSFLMKRIASIERERERESKRPQAQPLFPAQKRMEALLHRPDIRYSFWEALGISQPKARKSTIHRSARQQQRCCGFYSR